MSAPDTHVIRFDRLLSGFRSLNVEMEPDQSHGSITSMRELLGQFGKLVRTTPANVDIQGMQDLLAAFRAADSNAHEDQVQSDEAQVRSHEALFTGFRHACEAWRREQEDRADDFNILAVLQLTGKELRHSMALAWLLCRHIDGLGTHAQGSLGFRYFLREVGLPESFADTSYRVAREVSGDSARVDIEVYARGEFLLHIENKIWSGEGADQTDREWADMQRRADWLEIPHERRSKQVIGLFLSPTGAAPLCPSFRVARWGQVARAFDLFADTARPPDVRLFAAHYAKAIRRFVTLAGDQREADQ